MIVRCIFGCAVFLLLAIVAVPIYYGVSEQKAMITASTEATQANDSLSFDDIYEIASEGKTMDAEALNEMAPAAGDGQEDGFSSGFQDMEHPALTDEPEEIMTEEETPAL